MGASGSEARKIFQRQKEFVMAMLGKLKISSTGNLVGIVTHGVTARVALKFGLVVDSARAEQEIAQLPYPGDGQSLIPAIKTASNELFSLQNGARPKVAKKLLIFVNKFSEEDKDALKAAVEDINANDIKGIIVAVGNEVDSDALNTILPVQKVLTSQNADGLNEVLEDAIKASKSGTFILPGLLLTKL